MSAFLVLSLLAGGAAAAVVASLDDAGRLGATVAPAPVRFVVGEGGTNSRYFSPHLQVSADGAVVTGGLKAHAGADARVKDVLRIVAGSGAPRNVTLSATQVRDEGVEAFTWTVQDGGAVVGTLDMRAASPSVTFALPADETRTMTLRVDVADGGGRQNTPPRMDLQMRVG